jgi:hypothetical protein
MPSFGLASQSFSGGLRPAGPPDALSRSPLRGFGYAHHALSEVEGRRLAPFAWLASLALARVFLVASSFSRTSRSLSDGLQLPPAFPDAGQRLSQFLIRDVQIALRCLHVGGRAPVG